MLYVLFPSSGSSRPTAAQHPPRQAQVPHVFSEVGSSSSGHRESSGDLQRGGTTGDYSAGGARYWETRYDVLYRDVALMKGQLAAIAEDVAAVLAAFRAEGGKCGRNSS